ncbi:MAG: hypothetical protein M1834_000846 [Cirrosporium novae-zelandiae]|nr:MAG: hypothetical protein M1834_000846 [Cirrosporium novae-zelandiae]
MSKRQFKSQASSSRAFSGAGFGSSASFSSSSSQLSYIAEPPDLSNISDPNVVVPFKNLLKKAGTTKEKAAEELLEHFTKPNGEVREVEEAILEAWVKIYPRLSIDGSRRVRQLTHTLQGKIALSCGKRIARHMPMIVGAWLAGLYDPERLVTKAAQESLWTVFETEKKREGVWKAFHKPILEYVENIILRESVQTLSDERSISPDEAEAKYARVITTAISLFNNCITRLGEDIKQKKNEQSLDLLNESKLWSFAGSSDVGIRRSIYQLLQSCLRLHGVRESLDMKVLNKALLSDALSANQLGSALRLTEVLVDFTRYNPYGWTEKPIYSKRLKQFLKKGSRSGPPQFWKNIEELVREIPLDGIVGSPVEGEEQDLVGKRRDFLDAYRAGIKTKDEPQANLTPAWKSYIATVGELSNTLPEKNIKQAFFKNYVIPIIEQFIRPRSELEPWSCGTPSDTRICSLAFEEIINRGEFPILEETWRSLSSSVIEDMKASLPEKSGDFDRSQANVSKEVDRWFNLQSEIFQTENIKMFDTTKKLVTETTESMFNDAIDLLKARIGKPYGAAALLEAAVRNIPWIIFGNEDITRQLSTFFTQDVPNLISSPSSAILIKTLLKCQDKTGFNDSLDAIVGSLMRQNEDLSINMDMLQQLFTSVNLDHSQVRSEIEEFAKKSLDLAFGGNSEYWNVVNALLQNPSTSTEIRNGVFLSLLQRLSSDDTVREAILGLDRTVAQNGKMIEAFIQSSQGSTLLAKLISLSESPDEEVARSSLHLEGRLRALLPRDQAHAITLKSTIEIVRNSLDEPDNSSLSVETLVELVQGAISGSALEKLRDVADKLLPSADQWEKATDFFLDIPPNTSLAASSVLGDCIFLVEAHDQQEEPPIPRDAYGLSAAFRLGLYTLRLILQCDILRFTNLQTHNMILFYLPLITQLANDHVSIQSTRGLWDPQVPGVEEDAVEFVSQSQGLVASWLRTHQSSEVSLPPSINTKEVLAYWNEQLSAIRACSPREFYIARAFIVIREETFELHGSSGFKHEQTWEATLKSISTSSNAFKDIAWLQEGTLGIKPAFRLCNELVADVTGLNFHKQAKDGIVKLSTLHVLNSTDHSIVDTIPTQRQVFFIKHLIQGLQSGLESGGLATIIMKALAMFLPKIREIYGSHWSDIILFIERFWAETTVIADDNLPTLITSLRLLSTLRSLVGSDGNDDLDDAWTESSVPLQKGLLHLLKLSQGASDTHHQPLAIFHELLARQIKKLPLETLEEPRELYPLLYADSVYIQQVAFDILHKQIPQAQEQVSLDVALSKSMARLPDELLSLILETPELASNRDLFLDNERKLPMNLRGYLLSWKLVFDHFTSSSYKVKSDYVDNMKEAGSLPSLLDLTFKYLGHESGKPFDASKIDIETFSPETEESPKRYTHHFLCHLYYLSLRNLSTLVRNWWINSKGRLKIPVETWTAKHISPLVITADLSAVTSWASSLPPSTDEDQQLEIKVHPRAHELTASFPIDEETLSIAIRLPPSYPLTPVLVEGLNRVAVSQQKWQSWLISTQGVITFSHGSLVDGLLSFKKNVLGALKGQQECAICYSVISGDKQLPSKRCATCKNMFHSSCLFRWFKSSNASTCPLCRNSFNYS